MEFWSFYFRLSAFCVIFFLSFFPREGRGMEERGTLKFYLEQRGKKGYAWRTKRSARSNTSSFSRGKCPEGTDSATLGHTDRGQSPHKAAGSARGARGRHSPHTAAGQEGSARAAGVGRSPRRHFPVPLWPRGGPALTEGGGRPRRERLAGTHAQPGFSARRRAAHGGGWKRRKRGKEGAGSPQRCPAPASAALPRATAQPRAASQGTTSLCRSNSAASWSSMAAPQPNPAAVRRPLPATPRRLLRGGHRLGPAPRARSAPIGRVGSQSVGSRAEWLRAVPPPSVGAVVLVPLAVRVVLRAWRAPIATCGTLAAGGVLVGPRALSPASGGLTGPLLYITDEGLKEMFLLRCAARNAYAFFKLSSQKDSERFTQLPVGEGWCQSWIWPQSLIERPASGSAVPHLAEQCSAFPFPTESLFSAITHLAVVCWGDWASFCTNGFDRAARNLGCFLRPGLAWAYLSSNSKQQKR